MASRHSQNTGLGRFTTARTPPRSIPGRLGTAGTPPLTAPDCAAASAVSALSESLAACYLFCYLEPRKLGVPAGGRPCNPLI
jgi:hypothetical protein